MVAQYAYEVGDGQSAFAAIEPTCSTSMRKCLPVGQYLRRWAEPGIAEADFSRFDVATIIKRIYILFRNSHMPIASEHVETLDLVKLSEALAEWLKEED